MARQVFTWWQSTATVGCVLIATALFAGCNRTTPLPATYLVHGKVTYRDAKPVAGAMVRFHPESEPRVITSAVAGTDGTYSLLTKRDGLQAGGAVAGPNRVTVLHTRDNRPANGMAGQQQANIVSTEFPAPYEVKPGDNEINLNVDQPGR